MLSERRKYCVIKKYDCSDCDFNQYHKDKECDDSFLEYKLKESYNQALYDLKFNLEEEKKMYVYSGHSLDIDKWLNDYLESKLG